MKTINKINHPIEKRLALSSDRIMQTVIMAMVPSLLMYIYLFGVGIIIQLVIASLTAFVCEFLVAKLRSRKLTKLDISSGILTAWILSFCLPVTSIYWLVIVAVCFAILLAKHCFGGMGMNIFNPAMVGFCFMTLSFAYQLNLYPLGYVGIQDSFSIIFGNKNLTDIQTGATMLASIKANPDYNVGKSIILDIIQNKYFFINISWLIGGAYLWIKKIADWKISFSFLLSYFIFSFTFLSPLSSNIDSANLLLGATIFGACFIITDPVTAPSSPKGRVFYAILIAFIAIIIKKYSQMPDSIAFAVILGNLSFPLIDEFSKTKYSE